MKDPKAAQVGACLREQSLTRYCGRSLNIDCGWKQQDRIRLILNAKLPLRANLLDSPWRITNDY